MRKKRTRDEIIKQKMAWRAKSGGILAAKHGWVCWYCGRDVEPDAKKGTWYAWELDHILPKSRGGRDNIENLAIACVLCNQAKFYFGLSDFLKWLNSPKKQVSEITKRLKVYKGRDDIVPGEWGRGKSDRSGVITDKYTDDIVAGLRKPFDGRPARQQWEESKDAQAALRDRMEQFKASYQKVGGTAQRTSSSPLIRTVPLS